MDERYGKRKKWVKRAAAVFFAALFTLTFFSNTIMNASLAQVMVQYVNRGSISNKVRGDGVLEAGRPVAVTNGRQCRIRRAAVLEGEQVKAGDVIYELEEGGNEALSEAEQSLEQLRLSYQASVLRSGLSAQKQKELESGRIGSLEENRAALEAAETAVAAAQAEYDAAKASSDAAAKQNELAGNLRLDISGEQSAVNTAQAAYDQAAAAYDRVKSQADSLQGMLAQTGSLDAAQKNRDKIREAKELQEVLEKKRAGEWNAAAAAVTDAKEALEAAQKALEDLPPEAAEEERKRLTDAVTAAQTGYEEKLTQCSQAEADLKEAQENRAQKEKELTEAETYIRTAADTYNTYQPQLADALEQLQSASGSLKSTQDALREKNRVLQDKQQSTEVDDAKRAAGSTYTDARFAAAEAAQRLAEEQEKQAKLLTDILSGYQLYGQFCTLQAQERKVEELREKEEDVVRAPVDGVILALSRQAGEQAEKGEILAQVQENGEAFVLRCRIDREEALLIGAGADAVPYGSVPEGVQMKLLSSQTVLEEPDKSELLIEVKGDLRTGEALQFYFPVSSREYELVVPNSAVRKDSSGSFVLVLQRKSSPLGNRYTADRTPVEVLASDEYNSAVYGALEAGSQVITTADKPVEAGDRVRLGGV